MPKNVRMCKKYFYASDIILPEEYIAGMLCQYNARDWSWGLMLFHRFSKACWCACRSPNYALIHWQKIASKTMSWFQGLSTGSLTTLHSSATCVISWFSCVEIWSAPGDYQLNFRWRCVEGALLCWRSIVRHWFSQGKHVSSFFRRENMSKAYFERQVILKRE